MSESSALFAWVRQHGGRVDDRVGITVVDGLRGAFALEDIGKGSLLLDCPWRLIIGSNGPTHTDAQCDVIRALVRELELADKSLWHDYLRLDGSLDQRIPTLWDDETLKQLQGLPPYDATRHTEWFCRTCLAGRPYSELDPLTKRAFMAYITRSTDRGMVPVLDLLNHHNGELNTTHQATETGLRVLAREPIPAGNQIFCSYGVEPTSNIFRDYGFVEPWPRIWAWTDRRKQTHTFVQFPAHVVAVEPTPEFTGDLGRKYVPLEDYQLRARKHTRRLPSGILRRFRTAAQALLDELPTSLAQDARVLHELHEQSERAHGKDREAENKLGDLISCVHYRMQFKTAVQEAIAAIGPMVSESMDQSAGPGRS